MRAVGYRQAWEHLEGGSDAPTFRERAIFATRQLAKRQTTWLRGELDARWFDPDDGASERHAQNAVDAFLGQSVVKFVNTCSTAFYLPEQIVKMSWSENMNAG